MGRCSSQAAWLGLLLVVGCRGGGMLGDGGERADGAPGDGGHDLSVPGVRCDNGERDGDESGRDCGGSCAPCGDGEGCVLGRDCTSTYCRQGRCVPDDGCGWSCDANEQCVGGACRCGGANGEVCEQGWRCCGDHCVDLMNDFQNCGACGHVCEYSDTQCIGGGCTFVDWFGCMSCPYDPLCPIVGRCTQLLDAGLSLDGGTSPDAANP